MKTLLFRILPVAAFAVVFGSSATGWALGPLDIEVGALGGYAFKPPAAGDSDTNNNGFGLGGRAGVAIFNIYGGVKGMYYFGLGNQQSYLYGLEAGYNLNIGPVTIRPQFGVDDFTRITGGNPVHHVALEPAVVVLVTLGIFYIGADARYLIVIKRPSVDNYSLSTPAVDLQLGFRF